MAIKHTFVSGVADGGDASLLRPSNWNDNHADTTSVAYYGAVGDGSVDDTAAIQAAIDAAHVSALADGSSALVRVPAGVYKLTAPLVLKNRVRLIGDGLRGVSVLSQTGTGAVIKLDDTADRALWGVEIAHMELRGNLSDTVSGDGIQCISTPYGTSNCSFHDLFITRCGRSGLYFYANDGVAWNQYLSFDNIFIGDGTSSANGCQSYAIDALYGFSTNSFRNIRVHNNKLGIRLIGSTSASGFRPQANVFDTVNVQNIDNGDSVVHGIHLSNTIGSRVENCYIERIGHSDTSHASACVMVDGAYSRGTSVNGGVFASYWNGIKFAEGEGGSVENATYHLSTTDAATITPIGFIVALSGVSGSISVHHCNKLQGTGTAYTNLLYNPYSKVLNLTVKDFGAVGDGVTDDTAAIQAALDALAGSTVKLDAGANYKVTSTLSWPDNTTIEGCGTDPSDGSVITFSGTGYAIATSGPNHVRTNMRGVRIQLNNAGASGGISVATSVDVASGLCTFDNVQVSGIATGQYGINLRNPSHVSFRHCLFGYGTGGTGARIYSGSYNTGVITAIDTVFGRVGEQNYGLELEATEGVPLDAYSFQGCYFGGKTSNVRLGAAGTGSVRQVNFSGCHFENTTAAGRFFEVGNAYNIGLYQCTAYSNSNATGVFVSVAGKTLDCLTVHGLEVQGLSSSGYVFDNVNAATWSGLDIQEPRFSTTVPYLTRGVMDGGFKTKLGAIGSFFLNKTGATAVKGSVVSPSTTTDKAIKLQSSEYDAVGVLYYSGAADGSSCVVIQNGRVPVLLADGTGSAAGNLAICSATDGRAEAHGTIPPASTDTHFKEIGHFTETKSSGTNVLAEITTHFN